jgi:predicted nucleic acid-binding protein
MGDKTFLDTNILVYAFDAGDERKHKIASALIAQGFQEVSAVISTQVLKEFFVTVTQKTARKMSVKDAEQAVRNFALWRVIETSVPLVLDAIGIHHKQRISFWDAMIVAAAHAGGCRTLLSEDLHHNSVVGNVRILNLFA